MSKKFRVQVVAGGGGAGSSYSYRRGSGRTYGPTPGGGGGGGYREENELEVGYGTHTIIVGYGGSAGRGSRSSGGISQAFTDGESGGKSAFGELLKATGGGGGGSYKYNNSPSDGFGRPGGSGGGASDYNDTAPGSGIPTEGFDGFATHGGGAGSSATKTHAGGGKSSDITGTNANYSPGGRGDKTRNNTNSAIGSGGHGGARDGSLDGIKGQVVLRYPTSEVAYADGGTVTTKGNETILIFDTPGTFTLDISWRPQLDIKGELTAFSGSAIVIANIFDVGHVNGCDEVGLVYSLTSQADPDSTAPNASTYSDFTALNINKTNSFTSELPLTGLLPGTVYYVRAYAKNTHGYSYSEERQFVTKTDSGSAEVATLTPTIIGTGASLDAEILTPGTSEITEKGFVISERHIKLVGSDAPLLSGYERQIADFANKLQLGTFNLSVAHLRPGVTHYARAYVRNEKGYTYGNEVAFQVQGMGPRGISQTVLTNEALTNVGRPESINIPFHGVEPPEPDPVPDPEP